MATNTNNASTKTIPHLTYRQILILNGLNKANTSATIDTWARTLSRLVDGVVEKSLIDLSDTMKDVRQTLIADLKSHAAFKDKWSPDVFKRTVDTLVYWHLSGKLENAMRTCLEEICVPKTVAKKDVQSPTRSGPGAIRNAQQLTTAGVKRNLTIVERSARSDAGGKTTEIGPITENGPVNKKIKFSIVGKHEQSAAASSQNTQTPVSNVFKTAARKPRHKNHTSSTISSIEINGVGPTQSHRDKLVRNDGGLGSVKKRVGATGTITNHDLAFRSAEHDGKEFRITQLTQEDGDLTSSPSITVPGKTLDDVSLLQEAAYAQSKRWSPQMISPMQERGTGGTNAPPGTPSSEASKLTSYFPVVKNAHHKSNPETSLQTMAPATSTSKLSSASSFARSTPQLKLEDQEDEGISAPRIEKTRHVSTPIVLSADEFVARIFWLDENAQMMQRYTALSTIPSDTKSLTILRDLIEQETFQSGPFKHYHVITYLPGSPYPMMLHSDSLVERWAMKEIQAASTTGVLEAKLFVCPVNGKRDVEEFMLSIRRGDYRVVLPAGDKSE